MNDATSMQVVEGCEQGHEQPACYVLGQHATVAVVEDNQQGVAFEELKDQGGACLATEDIDRLDDVRVVEAPKNAIFRLGGMPKLIVFAHQQFRRDEDAIRAPPRTPHNGSRALAEYLQHLVEMRHV
eukprot:CAMPEP_0180503950 /NCGR_PEP_ID=MMETSP1036_2-20121128/46374_1 /TAXON_ID=632150 /ORGANISM="Azadinium spinosum, Strain 3D9" /LENGTH=126 /DNA_ID=CAMNT_0022513149 /DNA_START=659 /DNA_END=1039 /DNA_ORIENTATION=+